MPLNPTDWTFNEGSAVVVIFASNASQLVSWGGYLLNWLRWCVGKQLVKLNLWTVEIPGLELETPVEFNSTGLESCSGKRMESTVVLNMWMCCPPRHSTVSDRHNECSRGKNDLTCSLQQGPKKDPHWILHFLLVKSGKCTSCKLSALSLKHGLSVKNVMFQASIRCYTSVSTEELMRIAHYKAG